METNIAFVIVVIYTAARDGERGRDQRKVKRISWNRKVCMASCWVDKKAHIGNGLKLSTKPLNEKRQPDAIFCLVSEFERRWRGFDELLTSYYPQLPSPSPSHPTRDACLTLHIH